MKLSLAVFCFAVLFFVDISNAKYEIILDRLEVFENDKMFKLIDIRVKKIKDNKKVINGKVDLLQDLTDDHSSYLSVYNFDAGQYKKYFIERNATNLCTSTTEDRLMKDAIKDFMVNTESKIELGKCPWPAGVIDVKNYFPEDSFLPPYISMASEKWKAEFRFYKNGEFQGGFIKTVTLKIRTILELQ